MLNLADLLRIPQVDTGLRFGISPDGKHVAFAWNQTGEWEIYEIDLSTQGAREANLITGGAGAKFSPQYSPDGQQIAYALDRDGSESYHIVLKNLEAGTQKDLTPSYAYAQHPNFAFSPVGKSIAILSDERGQFALYLLSIETGERNLILDIHRPLWDVVWSPDGKWIAVEAEMQASDRGIFLVEVETGTNKQIKLNAAGLNAQHPAWSPDSKFLAFSAQSGECFDIGLYSIQTGEIKWLTQSSGDDAAPCWSWDGKQLCWLHAEGAANCIYVYEDGLPVKQVRLEMGIHHLPQFTPDGEILFLFESPKQPPDLWKLKLDGTFEQLTNSMPAEYRDAGFVVPEEISYENAGINVPALLYRGEGENAVINIHGGPNWHVQFLWDPFAAHLASRGWTVLEPNYRGSTGYGRSWQIASRYDMGRVDTRDCAAGVEYLKRNDLADRIAVTGRSHGGYLTMTCLTQFPGLWCGGSAVVPFLNWFKSHEESREDLQHWNIENMGDPEEDYERWYNASPYFFLDRVNAPVQLICGVHDPRCPSVESLDARDKLVELGKEVQLLLYEDEGHSFLKIENVIDAETKRVKFLEEAMEK
ncbi:MAG: prolyl oligopeptidase family serine peptidase [Bacteroidota bacterium]